MCAPRVTRHTSIRYSSSYHTRVNMGVSIFYTAPKIRAFRSARSRGNDEDEYFARNARCTVTTDLLVWYSNTQNDFLPWPAIFSVHTLASPSGRNVNYHEKQLSGGGKLSCSFYLYRFRIYVSYGFPILNVCNPGVHYETPCIMEWGHAVAQWLRHCAKPEGSRDRFPMVSLAFFIDIILPAALWPWDWLSL
jgi:hypothetical protein